MGSPNWSPHVGPTKLPKLRLAHPIVTPENTAAIGWPIEPQRSEALQLRPPAAYPMGMRDDKTRLPQDQRYGALRNVLGLSGQARRARRGPLGGDRRGAGLLCPARRHRGDAARALPSGRAARERRLDGVDPRGKRRDAAVRLQRS